MQLFSLSGAGGALVALFIVLAVAVIVRAFGRKRNMKSGAVKASGQTQPASEAGRAADRGVLVAVIAAAVAAASGMEPGGFRVTAIEPSEGSGNRGFNTPVWGHADRLARSFVRG